MPPDQSCNAFGFTTLSEEKVSRELSFALEILDETTERIPKVPVKVRIPGLPVVPVKSLSGYYLFFNLPQGTYTVSIDADSYIHTEETITIPRDPPDDKNPLFEITIKKYEKP